MKTSKPSGRKRSGDRGDEFQDEPLPNKIGKSLREMYDTVLSEDVPDDFLALLAKADEKSGNQ